MSVKEPEDDPLARAAGGELPPDDAAVRAALDSPGGEEERSQWARTVTALDDLGEEERRLLAEAADEAASLDDVLAVRAGLERAGLRDAAPRRRSLLVWGAAAAGLALTVALFPKGEDGGGGEGPVFLGAGELELLEPAETAAVIERFTWRPRNAAPAARYALVVRADGEELLRREDLAEPFYALSAEERGRLAGHASLEWRVGLRLAGQSTYGSWSSRVSSRR